MLIASAPSVAPDHWMEQMYWWSQAGLFFVAVGAAIAAYRQVSALKLFEIVKYLQDENFRHARRIVIREISPRKDMEWWLDPELEAAASSCAGHYDIVGRLLQFRAGRGLRRLFIRGWAESVVRTYELLSNFISLRRKAEGPDYKGFEWLYKRAKKIRPTVGQPWPPIPLKT